MRCSNFHIQSISVAERMKGTVEFSSLFVMRNRFANLTLDAGEKKELRLFDSRHKPRKWKDRLRWLKALGRQLIFFSHPLHSHLDAMDNSLSTECTNIDEAMPLRKFIISSVYLKLYVSFVHSILILVDWQIMRHNIFKVEMCNLVQKVHSARI